VAVWIESHEKATGDILLTLYEKSVEQEGNITRVSPGKLSEGKRKSERSVLLMISKKQNFEVGKGPN